MASPTSNGTVSPEPMINATWTARTVATVATTPTRGSTALKVLASACAAERVSIARRRVTAAGTVPAGASRAARLSHSTS